MLEAFLKLLSEKFGDELKDKFSKFTLFGFLLLVLLIWGGTYGRYQSAALGLLNQKLATILDEHEGVASLPIYVFILCALINAISSALIKNIARKYFKIVCDQPRIKEMIEKMISDHSNVRPADERQFLAELREAERELQRRRGRVKRVIETYHLLSCLSLSFLGGSLVGNILDFAIGIVLLAAAIVTLHRSVALFISQVTPWYAKVEAFVAGGN